MAGQDGKRRSGRQQTEEPAASQEGPGSMDPPPPRRSGRTASTTPAPDQAGGQKKAASGRAGSKSAPAKASGAKRSRSPTPAAAASKKSKGKAADGAEEPPAKSARRSSKPPIGNGKQVAASGGKGKQAPASKGKAAASGSKGKAAASGKGKASQQKRGGRRGSSAALKGGEEDEEGSGSGSGEEEEEEEEGSGSEGASEKGSEEGSSGGEGSDEEGSEGESSEEEEIDQTVYAPPKVSALPADVAILEGDAEHDVPPLAVPSTAVADLLAAYNGMRAFSWQLRLSPFSFPDLCAAVMSTQPTSLMDEAHVCILRALAMDEVPKERAERQLDPALLDHMTWPAYVWEFLNLTDEPLAAQEWLHRAPADKRPGSAQGGAAGGAGKKGGRGGAGGGKKAAAGAADKDGAAGAAEAAAGSSDAAAPPAARRKSFVPLSSGEREAMDLVLETPDPAVPALPPAADTFSAPGVPPQPAPPPPDYYRQPVGLKAAILARLCDHLLDCVTIRAEIDRREGAGEWVAGKGGKGGAFPIMTEDERKSAEEKAAKLELTDANADVCVLCGVGGTLLCCDACPAAYHVRCVGESSRAAGASSWFCPECRVGGRGECAGLRIPVAARNRWKQPLHLMHGTVCRTAAPAVRSSGKHAEELEDGPVPAAWYHGEAAVKELSAATRVKGQDEVPPGSSYDGVEHPPEIREEEYEWGSGPVAYVNRYRHAWPAAVAAIAAAVDDAKRRRHRGGIWVPTGTCGRLVVTELPAPLGMPRFSWAQPLSRTAVRPAARCGRCKACLRPSLCKPCLAPPQQEEVSAADNAKLSVLIAQVVQLERDYWPLAEGPWAGADGMRFRHAWLAALRSAGSVRELAHALLQLEAALRPLAFAPEWRGPEAAAGAAAPGGGAAAGGAAAAGSRPTSRCVSRAASGVDLESMAAASADVSASQGGAEAGTAAAAAAAYDAAGAAAAARAADPYDVRYEKLVPGGWEVDRRHHVARVHGVNRLPLAAIRKAARQSGWTPIPGVKYRKFRWHISPRMQWIAATEGAETAAQLALSMRQLEPMLQTATLERPKQEQGEPFYYASLLGKRPAAAAAGEAGAVAGAAAGLEYLLQIRPPQTPTLAQQTAMASMLQEQQKVARAQLQVQAAAAAAAAVASGQASGAAGALKLPSDPEQLAALQQAAAALQLPAAAAQQEVAAMYQQEVQKELQQRQEQAEAAVKPDGAAAGAEVKTEEGQEGEVAAQAQPQEQQDAQAAGSADASPKAEAPAEAAVPAEAAAEHAAEPAAEPLPSAPSPADAPQPAAEGAAPAEVAAEGVDSPMEVDVGVAPAATPAEGQPAAPIVTLAEEPAAATAATAAAEEQPAAPTAMAVEEPAAAPAASPAEDPAAPAVVAPVDAPAAVVAPVADVAPAPAVAPSAEPAGAEAAQPAAGDEAASEEANGHMSGGGSPMQTDDQLPAASQQLGSERDASPAKSLYGEDSSALLEAPAAAQAAKLRRLEAERAKAEAEASERAAKLVARQSAANLAKLGSDAARAAAGVLVPGGAALGGLALAATPLSTEQLVREAMAAREPVWAHESLLPLWLVEQYEERLRRQEANTLARETATAIRCQLLAADHDGEEALAAMHDAACAPADACDTCGAFKGDNEELDAVWISCDTCKRWFHGGCVRVTQAQADALADAGGWDCSGCKGFKRQQERAALRNQRQSKPPQAFSPDQGPGKKSGRPPLPTGKRVEGEEEVLAVGGAGSRRSGSRLPKKRSSAEPQDDGPLDPEEVERRRQERLERIRRRREEQGAPLENEPWFCPVCKYPDRGRPLFECAGCKDSFHFECAGMHAEEFAAKTAAAEEVKCLACQGKRVRAPSQAAINAAILVAQRAAGLGPSAEEEEDEDSDEEEEEEEEESGSSDEEGASGGGGGGGADVGGDDASAAAKAAARKSGGSKARSKPQAQLHMSTKVLSAEEMLICELARALRISAHTEATWMDAALRVLIKVMRLECASEFTRPVDLAAFPDYAQEVQLPMDLGTAKGNLHEGKYSSPLELLEHVKLVWANCRQFNEEGSDILADCADSQRAFDQAWRMEGLPTDASAWQPTRAAELRMQAAQRLAAMQPHERTALVTAAAAAAGIMLPTTAAPQPKPAQPKPSQPKPSLKRKAPEGLGAAPPAARPAPPSMPAAARPALAVPLAALAAAMPALAASGFAAPAAPPAGGGERPAPVSKRSRSKASADTGLQTGPWQQRAMQALTRLMQQEASEAFHEPVPRDVPGYHDAIKKPRCLEQIQRTLQRNKYAAPAELLADVQLVWDNCREYNEPDAPVVADAGEAEAFWRRCWAATGVQVSQRELAEKKAAEDAVRAAAAAEKQDANWRGHARKILYRLQKVKESAWFWSPVREDDAPGYHDVIKRPMDLATISDRLKHTRDAGGFASAADFLAHVQLVWDNCRTYNGDDHSISQDAETCRRQFEHWWVQAGFTTDGQVAGAEPEQAQQAQPATVGPTGATVSLAEDPVLQALMLKLPAEKQHQVVQLLQRMTPDQLETARAQLQAMAGVSSPRHQAQHAPAAQPQAQQGGYAVQQQQQLAQQGYGFQQVQQPQQQQHGFYGQQLQQQQPMFAQQAPQQPQQQQFMQQQAQPQQQGFFQQQQAPQQHWGAAAAPQAGLGGWQQPAPQPAGMGGWQQQQQQQPQQQAPGGWQDAARQLLQSLVALPQSAPFMQSGYLQQALPGAPPAPDFSTIASRLSAGAYARPLDLAADASRLFQAVAAVAPEGTELRAAAAHVQAVFEALWQQLMAPYAHY